MVRSLFISEEGAKCLQRPVGVGPGAVGVPIESLLGSHCLHPKTHRFHPGQFRQWLDREGGEPQTNTGVFSQRNRFAS